MLRSKKYCQWVSSNPFERLKGLDMSKCLQKKDSHISAGSVLVYECLPYLYMFQLLEDLWLHFTSNDTGIDVEPGSAIMRDCGEWRAVDMDFLPPYCDCRLPTHSELSTYYRICQL